MNWGLINLGFSQQSQWLTELAGFPCAGEFFVSEHGSFVREPRCDCKPSQNRQVGVLEVF